MNILTIDLGTTNIKVSVYDRQLSPLVTLSEGVNYHRAGDIVEFDPERYFTTITAMMTAAAAQARRTNGRDIVQVVLTGQAESLIVLDGNGLPLRPAISWLDMRSREECAELSDIFDAQKSYRITGQPEIIPTWPITKILWLKRHEKETFARAAHYLLLKDYIILRLSGRIVGDYSIYSFSYYFNITEKRYWPEILDYCGIHDTQLPALLPPCTIVGPLVPALVDPACGLTTATKINIGTLDHFAGMIGTGNIREGIVSESAGTVLSLATLVKEPVFSQGRLPLNCGPFPDSYVLLPVCESGGFSLEWYKQTFLPDCSFGDINAAAAQRNSASIPIFLPYLTGINAPDFNEHASGVFFGIRASHTRDDFSLSIMQGVACLLRKNIDYMEQAGIQIEKIISVGGGARSALWTQIKSDLTQKSVSVPVNEEAACFGAAIIAAVDEGYVSSYAAAAEEHIVLKKSFTPAPHEHHEHTYAVFNSLYEALAPVYALNDKTRRGG
ncbi:FGGY family carbohydrate kinase [uncultured Pluralibacter sp.]|uniref:FGGY-family carbohydrate kinase n=1 Tax=uncultured Pluralibacter sp. TaxID=1490864 RepID=UPI002618278F|nr:FGGY family carbohydrate kinase [uncultured Pluralibacter sp.]